MRARSPLFGRAIVQQSCLGWSCCGSCQRWPCCSFTISISHGWMGCQLSRRAAQPFYALLWPLYDYGQFGVQIFWGISGYIFFWKYGAAIHARKVAARDFFWLRFLKAVPTAYRNADWSGCASTRLSEIRGGRLCLSHSRSRNICKAAVSGHRLGTTDPIFLQRPDLVNFRRSSGLCRLLPAGSLLCAVSATMHRSYYHRPCPAAVGRELGVDRLRHIFLCWRAGRAGAKRPRRARQLSP